MIYIVNDHGGIKLKKYLIQKCLENNLEITDLYSVEDEADDYPVVANILAEKMKEEKDSWGVAICGSGQGINMAMNRYPWVRAALPVSTKQAKKTREHNDANCLSLGEGETSPEVAFEMLKVFIETKSPSEERHLRRVKDLSC
jgi:ribose 5-phosphate isomerase B